jgi:hypothetical protein
MTLRLTFAFIFGFATGVLVMDTRKDWVEVKERQPNVYEQVLCPPNWRYQIAQRYDDRNSKGEIVKKTWIRKCA